MLTGARAVGRRLRSRASCLQSWTEKLPRMKRISGKLTIVIFDNKAHPTSPPAPRRFDINHRKLNGDVRAPVPGHN